MEMVPLGRTSAEGGNLCEVPLMHTAGNFEDVDRMEMDIYQDEIIRKETAIRRTASAKFYAFALCVSAIFFFDFVGDVFFLVPVVSETADWKNIGLATDSEYCTGDMYCLQPIVPLRCGETDCGHRDNCQVCEKHIYDAFWAKRERD